jgi:hypothetical protein
VQPLVSSLLRSVLMVPRAPVTTNCSPVLSTLTLLGMGMRDRSSTWRVKALAVLCICLCKRTFQEEQLHVIREAHEIK